jgi:hypothetical protein
VHTIDLVAVEIADELTGIGIVERAPKLGLRVVGR